jgi:phosphatidylserine/phosphatidylglycerophosphate/cardiolipin synthase-like enzyme
LGQTREQASQPIQDLYDGSAGSLHHKFCVLDDAVVITGSYNWTRRARRTDENILVVRGDTPLAQGYQEAFERLLAKYHHRPAAPTVDTVQVLRRLEVIRHLLLLEDFETVAAQWPRRNQRGLYRRLPRCSISCALGNGRRRAY